MSLTPKRILIGLMTVSVFAGTLVYGQPLDERIPHRVITAEEIQKAGQEPFQRVLHYLLPEVFPKTDHGWHRTLAAMSIYVDNERLEPEYIDTIQPGEVKQIRIWEIPWEPSPMAFPTLIGTKYVVSIETMHEKQSG